MSFKDALQLCWRLNVQYLWIDALCIIQDDSEDWQKEAALMGDVYRNGICNVGVHAAADKPVDLYSVRDPQHVSVATWHVVRSDFDQRYGETCFGGQTMHHLIVLVRILRIPLPRT
jgi:hypothetical protein